MRKTAIHWILLAVFVVTPAGVLAQQAAQPKKEATQKQIEKTRAKREEPKKDEVQKQQEVQTQEQETKKEGVNEQTEEAQPKADEDAKLTSVPGSKALGMSILGNQEAPKALVIVPWKSSELGNGPNVSTLLDDSRRPVDKEVFKRMLLYYEIRSQSPRPSAATASGNTAAPANVAQRSKP